MNAEIESMIPDTVNIGQNIFFDVEIHYSLALQNMEHLLFNVHLLTKCRIQNSSRAWCLQRQGHGFDSQGMQKVKVSTKCLTVNVRYPLTRLPEDFRN